MKQTLESKFEIEVRMNNYNSTKNVYMTCSLDIFSLTRTRSTNGYKPFVKVLNNRGLNRNIIQNLDI